MDGVCLNLKRGVMRIIDKYLIKELIKYSLFSLIALTSIFLIFHFLEEISNHYAMESRIKYLLYLTPSVAHLMFMFSVLLGAIVTLGNLCLNREIQVLLNGCLSVSKITKKIILIALVFFSIGMIVGELFTPAMLERALLIKSNASGQSYSNSNSDIWLIQDNKFINIGQSFDGKKFKDITIYDFNKGFAINSISEGKSGNIFDKGINIEKLKTTSFLENNSTVELTQNQDEVSHTLSIQNFHINSLSKNVKTMTILELMRNAFHSILNKTKADLYILEIISRVIKPLTLVGMVLIALPRVISFSRNNSIGSMIFVGIGISLIFYLISKVFTLLSLQLGLDIFLSSFMPSILLILVGYLYSKKFLKEY